MREYPKFKKSNMYRIKANPEKYSLHENEMKQYMHKDFEKALKKKGKDDWEAYLKMKPC